jgi:hypothetical protein
MKWITHPAIFVDGFGDEGIPSKGNAGLLEQPASHLCNFSKLRIHINPIVLVQKRSRLCPARLAGAQALW